MALPAYTKILLRTLGFLIAIFVLFAFGVLVGVHVTATDPIATLTRDREEFPDALRVHEYLQLSTAEQQAYAEMLWLTAIELAQQPERLEAIRQAHTPFDFVTIDPLRHARMNALAWGAEARGEGTRSLLAVFLERWTEEVTTGEPDDDVATGESIGPDDNRLQRPLQEAEQGNP